MSTPSDVLLEGVDASFESCDDDRLKELVRAAVRHLHAFAADTRLSHAERRAGLEFLAAVGRRCDQVRDEFELLSDVLGVSTLVEADASRTGATPQTLTGPFYVAGSPRRAFGASMVEQDAGHQQAILRGRVSDPSGRAIRGALIDVWQNAANQLYAVQDAGQPEFNLRGVYESDDHGRYELRTIRPVSYPIPSDGPVGRLLEATGRHPWRAAHIHLRVSAPGYVALTTEIFDANSDYLDSDAVFGVTPELVVTFEPDGGDCDAATFDIVLFES